MTQPLAGLNVAAASTIGPARSMRFAAHRQPLRIRTAAIGNRILSPLFLTTMHGLHLTADLYDCRCDPGWLLDAQALGAACEAQVRAAGLQVVGSLFHAFDATAHGPGGVTATVLLAESHLCVHTWPEQAAVTLDVYVCNFGGDHSYQARALESALITLFAPERSVRNALQRGGSPAAQNPATGAP